MVMEICFSLCKLIVMMRKLQVTATQVNRSIRNAKSPLSLTKPLFKRQTEYWRHRTVSTALLMVNTAGHTSLFPHCWIILCMHTIYQPTVFNIRGPRCRFQYFNHTEISVHLKDFQSRGRRWIYHRGITSAALFSCVMVLTMWATL